MRFRIQRYCVLIGSFLLCVKPASAQEIPDIARRIVGAIGAQERMLWVDGTANITRTLMVNGHPEVVDYSTTQAGVEAIVAHCKAAHINTLVVDVKPLAGLTLYDSRVAPRMQVWQGHPLPNFDILAAFVQAGHKAGLQVDADINILSEGHKYYQVGPAYAHPDWQSVTYTVDRGLIAPDGSRLPIYVEGEPSASNRAKVLPQDTMVLSQEAEAMVGLETTGSDLNRSSNASSNTAVGQQLNLVIDKDDRVTGFVDSALLGDNPLSAPDEGYLISATRASDQQWIGMHLTPGAIVRFDLQTPLVPIAQAANEKVACFVNPLNPDVRRYELAMVRDIASRYDIDGFVLDRCRYADFYNDFSDITRRAFEQYIGHPVAHWPEDIYRFSPHPGDPIIPGPLYSQWIRFRAQTIRDFAADVVRTVHAVKPGLPVGTYVGSWYPAYYPVGVNWGSPWTPLHYSWFPDGYPDTGYAELFTWVSTGCYYPIATEEEAIRQGKSRDLTVEGAARISRLALANGTLLYPGIYVPDYEGHPEEMIRALQAAARQGEGWMIFDLSYIDQFNWWPYLEEAYPADALPPERLPDILTAIRSARGALPPPNGGEIRQ